MKPVRIFLVEDHELLRRGIQVVLAEQHVYEVCGVVSVGQDVLEQACNLRPDIFILDLGSGDMSGLSLTREIRKRLPDTEVLILSAHDVEAIVQEAIGAGARGYVLTSDSAAVLLQALEALSRHRAFFTTSVASIARAAMLGTDRGAARAASLAGRLTDRERQIVRCVADGQTSREIAQRLGISPKTVETHRSNILRKSGAHSAGEVVRYAIRHHVIDA